MTINDSTSEYINPVIQSPDKKLYPGIKSVPEVKVVAMFPFEAQEPSDLSFKTGDVIEVVQRTHDKNDWWKGKLNGKIGDFPANYVKEM